MDWEAIWKRAYVSAKRFDPEHAEDVAQEVCLHYASGRGQHQTVDQAVIDTLRRTSGRRGSAGYQLRRSLTRGAVGLDSVEVGTSHAVYQKHDDHVGRLGSFLGGVDRACFKLFYLWGFKEKEIGDLFGITESRVSQRLKGVAVRLRKAVAAEESPQMEKVLQALIRKAAKQTRRDLERQSSMEGVVSREVFERSKLECPEDSEVAGIEPGEMEPAYEAGFDEWLT